MAAATVLAAPVGTAGAVDPEVDPDIPPGLESLQLEPGQVPEQEELKPVRVEELTTAYSTTDRLPDGSYSMDVSAVPVNFQNPAGEWEEIDTTLVASRAPGFAAENAAADFSVRIPQNPGSTPVRFETDGRWVTMRMHGTTDAPVVEGDTAVFEEVEDAEEVRYEVTETGVKEEIVLAQAPEPSPEPEPLVYAYDLKTSPGLTPQLVASGAVEFRTAGGAVAFTIPGGNMVDSATPEGAYTTEVGYELTEVPGGWELSLVPDLGWLTDPARVYPVTIDPTMTRGPVRDCYLMQDQPTTSRCGSNAGQLKVGRLDGSSRRRSILDFDFSALSSTANIQHANLELYQDATQTTTTNSASYSVHRTDRRFGGRATWNNSDRYGRWTGGNPTGAAYDTLHLNPTAGSTWRYFNVANLIRDWHYGYRPQTAMVLKQRGETTNNQVSFLSANADPAFRRPNLNIHYTDDPPVPARAGDRSYFSYEERELSDKVTAKVNIGTGNLLLEAEDFSVAGVAGWDMAMTRWYNSAAHRSGAGSMGLGWSTPFGGSVRLTFPDQGSSGSKNRVFFFGPSGYRSEFDRRVGTDQFDRPEPGLNADLNKTDTGYRLRWFDESKYFFDDNGRLQRTEDSNGNQFTFAYDGTTGKLDTVTDTRDRTAKLTYTDGLITAVTVRRPDNTAMLRWEYTYAGTPAVMTSSKLAMVDNTAIGGTTSDTTGNVGAATTYGYAADGRLVGIADARENVTGANGQGGSTGFSYDSGSDRVEFLTRVTDDPDEPNSVTGFHYFGGKGDAVDDMCNSRDDNQGASSRTTVDGEQPGDADTTKYCVDGKGRVLRTTDPAGNRRSRTWTANSNVKTADLSGLGTDTEQYNFTYSNDNPTQATTPEGAQSRAKYDDTTNPHSATSVQGDDSGGTQDSWIYDYDDNNNLITAKSQEGPDKPGVEYRYCWTGKGQIHRIDPVTATGTRSLSTHPKKDASLGDAARCDADSSQGNDTLFSYNADHELTGVDRPAGGDQTLTYDQLSRVKTATDGRGVTTSYSYDGLDRVVKAVHSRANSVDETVSWTYDLAGNTTRVDDLNGANLFGYDELNRVVSESPQSPSGATAYAYDPAGNVTRIEVGGEPGPTLYGYDKLNRVVSIDDQRPGDAKITFGYDKKGNRDKTVFPTTGTGGNLVQEGRYDKDSNPTCIYSYRQTNAPGNGANSCPGDSFAGLVTYQGYGYTNPDNSKKTSSKYKLTDLGGRSTSYDYDAIKRLEKAEVRTGGSVSSVLRSFEYSYDRHSNLVEDHTTGNTPGLSTGTTWAAFNGGDEICATVKQATDPGLTCQSATSGRTSYTHDPAGNLTTATGGGAGTLGGLAQGYNLPGQTTNVRPPGALAGTAMAYDGVMQDRRTRVGNQTMSYGYAGLAAQNDPGFLGIGAHKEIFVRDPGGNLVAMITNATTGAARYYLTDDQKSVIATTDHTGGDVTRYLYEPYGEKIRSWVDPHAGAAPADDGAENASLSAPATDHNPYGYASGYHDPGTGFIKFGTRYYIPQHATWTQRDPEPGSLDTPTTLNGYNYAGGNPVNRTDTSGRLSWDDVGGVLEAVWAAETELAIWSIFYYITAASVLGIGFGLYLCMGGATCVFGAPMVFAGGFGLYAAYQYGREAAESADERW